MFIHYCKTYTVYTYDHMMLTTRLTTDNVITNTINYLRRLLAYVDIIY